MCTFSVHIFYITVISQSNRLGLVDFRQICSKIQNSNEIKYAVKTAEIYQRKGQDFSEEVNSHFIQACVRSKSPLVALEYFLKPKNRLAAWTTATSLNRLLESALANNANTNLLEVILILKSKGLHLNKRSIELCVEIGKNRNDEGAEEFRNKIVEVAKEVLSAEEFKEIVKP